MAANLLPTSFYSSLLKEPAADIILKCEAVLEAEMAGAAARNLAEREEELDTEVTYNVTFLKIALFAHIWKKKTQARPFAKRTRLAMHYCHAI